jgi:hypothetical protein
MYVSSIRVGACLVGLSSIRLVDAACGEIHEAEFNAHGFPQGKNVGELFSAVQCFLHNLFCDTNSNGNAVYPTEARGPDSTNLKLYYGADISKWCVGRVQDFSFIFQNEVSNEWRMTVTRPSRCISNFCRCITGHLQPTAALGYQECDGHDQHVLRCQGIRPRYFSLEYDKCRFLF